MSDIRHELALAVQRRLRRIGGDYLQDSQAIADDILKQFDVRPKAEDEDGRRTVVADWMETLSLQQQSVVLLATRGPDGIRKHHPCKAVQRAYRGTVLCAGERGRFLHLGEVGDNFMSMDVIADSSAWADAVKAFFDHVDEMPHHFVAHLAHAAQILGEKHPVPVIRDRWRQFYLKWVDDLHLSPERTIDMDVRLGDWGAAERRLASRGIPYGTNGVRVPGGKAIPVCPTAKQLELRRKPDEATE